jgi:hypothetical protein
MGFRAHADPSVPVVKARPEGFMRDPNNAKPRGPRHDHTRKFNFDPPFMRKRRFSPAAFRLYFRSIVAITPPGSHDGQTCDK